jgi:hypothetical protein
VYYGLKGRGKKATVICFTVLTLHFPGSSVENHKIPTQVNLSSDSDQVLFEWARLFKQSTFSNEGKVELYTF